MRLLVFDSGVGGLSVVREITRALPQAAITYLADTAVFPYGSLEPDVLVARVTALMAAVVPTELPDAIVIACNTASTLVLPPLRARWTMPIVGTVPAVKPAAEQSRSRLVSVLATPGTVRRDYTRDLIRTHGGDCAFTLVGSVRLASLVERVMDGDAVDDGEIAAELLPCFVENGGRFTDMVVLACTHFPLIVDRLEALAPWPVTFVDPAPAIARRVVAVTGAAGGGAGERRCLVTGPAPSSAMLAGFGFPPALRLSLRSTDDLSDHPVLGEL